MPPFSLAKFLKKRGELRQILNGLLGENGHELCILDVDGRSLIGAVSGEQTFRHPVVFEGETIGWIAGPSQAAGQTLAAPAAALVEFLLNQEGEKKSLAGELIERYRELSLLYHLSDRMAVSPQPDAIANVALEETTRLIPADAGIIMLRQAEQPDAEGPVFQAVAACGSTYHMTPSCCLIERVLDTGKAELANAISGDDYFVETKGRLISMLCAPLKTEKGNLGVIILVGNADRVFTAGELKLLNTVALQVAPAIEITRLHQMAIEKARFEHELQMARKVQESLLPIKMPAVSGWSFGKRWNPAREVSGDFYDIIDEGGGELGLVIADVTDKGMPASLFSVFTRTALRASTGRKNSPAETIAQANRLVCQDSHGGLFATLFYARLQTVTGEVTYVNAGHNPPLFYHVQPDEIRQLKLTGLPLGIDLGIELNEVYEQAAIRLAPGEFILFYTDGITEAVDSSMNEYGLERLIQVVFDHRRETVEQILDAVERDLYAYTGQNQVSDDVTMLLVMRDKE